MEEFVSNEVIIEFVSNAVDEQFGHMKKCKWLKYDLFKEERTKILIKKLKSFFSQFIFDSFLNASHPEDIEITWEDEYAIGFSSGNYDPGARGNFDYFCEITTDVIPRKIIDIFIDCIVNDIRLPKDISYLILSFLMSH